MREGSPHPAKLAYDRPSNKLIGFLSKHYGLKGYVPQNNNYVVFNQYWDPSVTRYTPMRAPAAAAQSQPEATMQQKAQRTVRFADDEQPPMMAQ